MIVKIYSTKVCKYCDEAKSHMAQKQIPFENIVVTGNPELIAKARQLSGSMQVPVIVIGEKVIVGFDRDEFDSVYEREANK